MDKDLDWPNNYFNYFTEVEEHFQRARGSGLFMLSPLDWALIETWKINGVPLEAVLRGIDKAFEKWRSGKKRTQAVNSLAYCTQAVMTEAEILAGATTGQPAPESNAPFTLDELRSYMESNIRHLSQFSEEAFRNIATTLSQLLQDVETHYADLEELERRLSALEEKMIAAARMLQTDEDLLTARRELDIQLKPYRGKMSADQISMLERQFLDRRVIESKGLRRLSLFYFDN